MPICLSCPSCGAVHPSRARARSRSHFPDVNAAVGPVLETCPTCGTRGRSEPHTRFWQDDAPPRRRTAGRLPH